MPPRFRRPIAAILAVVAVLSVLGPAGAVGALLPPANVLGFDCDVEMPWFTGDVVAGSDGVTRGFARFMEGCPGQDAERIWYIEGRGSAWTRTVTPYTGAVMAAAWDTTGTYLLHQPDDGTVRITKRTAAGVFTGGRRIAPSLGEIDMAMGDVAASGGQWWAVWSEPAGGGRPAAELYQARTVGPDQARTRITRNRTADTQPTIALRRNGATLAWTRALDANGSRAELRVATSTPAGPWRSRGFEQARRSSMVTGADLFVGGTATYLTWSERDRVVVSDNKGGTFNRKVFGTPGFRPKVRGSQGRVFVAWQTPEEPSSGVGSTSKAILAERNGTTWTSLVVSPDRTTTDEVVGLSATRGKATVLFANDTLWARAQQ